MSASVPPTPTTTAPEGVLPRLVRDPGEAWSRLAEWATSTVAALRWWLAAGAAFVLSGLVLIARIRAWRAARMAAGARFVVILPPPDPELAGGEVLWSNLHDLLRPRWRRLVLGQPHVSFEFRWSASGVELGLWVPGQIPPGLVERAVEAAWPGCRVQTRAASAPLADAAATSGGELRLWGPEWFPLRHDHPADPLRALLGAGWTTEESESAVVQVLARPVTGRRRARAHRAARAMRSGGSPTAVGRLLDLLLPGKPPPAAYGRDPTVPPDVRDVLAKAAGPAWEAVVRYGAGGPSGREHRGALRGRAHAVASAFAAYAGRNGFRRHRLRNPATALDRRRLGRGGMLSVPELAALAHLPTDAAVVGLARAGARSVPPPPALPSAGLVLGEAEVASRRPVALAPDDARFHLHVIGATGSGKSTLLTNLILQDVAARRGVVVIDPKGDLVADVLERLPSSVEQETASGERTVVVLEPGAEAPPALNVLEGADPELAVDHLVGIFRRIFEAYWGPRTDDVLRSACLTLLSGDRDGRRPRPTLAEVPRLLVDERFRRPLVERLPSSSGLVGFWQWYDALSEGEQGRVVGPVMNKLRAFLLRDFVRLVVGSSESSFEMGAVLDGGICLVSVPKGVLGDETSRLLGSLVLARVWQAATARATRGQAERRTAVLHVDECQNFLTLPRSVDEMLAEARGYGLGLVLAHQHLDQLTKEMRAAISANARTKVFFATSPEDARALERHVAPELTGHDLAHLGGYQAALRAVVAGVEQPACTMRTRPPLPAVEGRAEAIRAAAAASTGRTEEQRRRAGVRNVIEGDPRLASVHGSGSGRPTDRATS